MVLSKVDFIQGVSNNFKGWGMESKSHMGAIDLIMFRLRGPAINRGTPMYDSVVFRKKRDDGTLDWDRMTFEGLI